MSEDTVFNSPSDGPLTFREVLTQLEVVLGGDEGARSLIIIGSDSQLHDHTANFVTALIAVRPNWGGRYFWRKESRTRMRTLRERIYHEAMLSITLAQLVRSSLRERLSLLSLDERVEVHVDVGEKGLTRDLIKEVVGMVKGNGFMARIKPDAFGASTVADRHT